MRSQHAGPVHHNNIVGMLKVYLCPSDIVQILMLPGSVSLDDLHNASLVLTVPEEVDTENWIISNLPILLEPSSVAPYDAVIVTSD